MDILRDLKDIIIAAGGGFLVLFFQWLATRVSVARGEFTGTWEESIFAQDQAADQPRIVEKRDHAKCKQNGDTVRADIKRVFPEEQKGREWSFVGRYRDQVLFGHFWSKNMTNPSFGTIFLQETQLGCFTGSYTRLDREVNAAKGHTFTIRTIPIEWRKLD